MKQTSQSPVGTSFHDTVIVSTPEILKKVLGAPEWEENTGEDKVNIEWKMETEEGDVFTVYDWKQDEPLEYWMEYEFHIGGKNMLVTETAKAEIKAAISKIK